LANANKKHQVCLTFSVSSTKDEARMVEAYQTKQWEIFLKQNVQWEQHQTGNIMETTKHNRVSLNGNYTAWEYQLHMIPKYSEVSQYNPLKQDTMHYQKSQKKSYL
jgi:hypothetical protein